MGITGGTWRTRAAGVAAVGLVGGLLGAGSALPAHAAPAQPPAAGHGLGALPGHGTLSPRAGLASLRAATGASVLAAPSAAPPAAVDLTPWTAPVGDQGRLNSCTTWAIDYAMLGWYAHRQGHAGAPFAPMYVYSQMQAKYGWSDGGGYPSDAYGVAAEQGVARQADYPQGSYDWHTQPTAAQRAGAAAHRSTGFAFLYQSYGSAPGAGARTAISEAIATGHPVALSMAVYSAFFGLSPSSHTMGLSGVTGQLVGYHEVLVVGYDAAGVRIQNSWGTGWGDRGFADLTWEYVQSRTIDASAMTGFAPSAPPAPTVAALTPAGGPSAGGTAVTVTGSGLTGATAVTVGGRAAAAVTVVDDTRLTAVVPAGTAGTAPVVVSTPGGRSAARSWTYLAAPAVTALGPSSGATAGGTRVLLRGRGFAGATAVTFGGIPGTDLRVQSDGALTVVTPALPPGVAGVAVTAPGGVSRPVPAFTAVAPPRLGAVTAGSGRVGTTVVLSGAGLDTVTAVLFDGVRAPVPGTSATALRVVAPRHSPGPVDVTVVTPYGTTGPGRFTYTP